MFAVVLNAASGTGTHPDAERIIQLFQAEGAEARIVPFKPDSLEDTVREALSMRPAALIAGGGDGTVSAVASFMVGAAVPMGILPFGTLNHFAKDLRVPLDIPQAVKVILAGHVTRVDVGYVNARAFINNSSIGVYPSIVSVRENLRRQGHAKWPALAIAIARVIRNADNVVVRMDVDGRQVTARTPFLFVGNNEYTIEGIHLGGRARVDSGKLYAYVAPRQHVRDLPKLLFWALIGRARQRGAFATFSATEITVELPGNRLVPISLDGEIATLATPLRYRIAHSQLAVIAPVG